MENMKCSLTVGDLTVTASKEDVEPTVEEALELFGAVYAGVGFVNDLDIDILGSMFNSEYQIKGSK